MKYLFWLVLLLTQTTVLLNANNETDSLRSVLMALPAGERMERRNFNIYLPEMMDEIYSSTQLCMPGKVVLELKECPAINFYTDRMPSYVNNY